MRHRNERLLLRLGAEVWIDLEADPLEVAIH
jgi:hypothetical protein